MTIVYVLLAVYLMFRGAREAGWTFPNSNIVEGILLFFAGFFLLLSQIL